MHVLRQYADEIDGLGSLVEAAANNPVTQGVALDVNPFWLTAYRFSRAGLSVDHLYEYLSLYPAAGVWPEQLISGEGIEGDAIDFNWRDPTDIAHRMTYHISGHDVSGHTLPFLVKIIAKPVEKRDFEARDKLVALAREQKFLTIVETRPQGKLIVSPGDDCASGGGRGTIGGFLRDQNTNAVYAATCGHVAALHSQVASGNMVGTCAYSCPPRLLTAGQACVRHHPHANRLDLALVTFNNVTPANVVTGVASHVAPHEKIVMRGKKGPKTFEVGSLVLMYSPGKSRACFENMFEVRPPQTDGILNSSFRTLIADVPQQGDSGAWVETASGKWCGILVAADNLMGYALDADGSLDEANRQFGMNLQLA